MTQSLTSAETPGDILSAVFGVLGDAQTYKNLVYLLLAFPLGLVYYIFVTVGFMLGLALSILGVGIGLLIATVIAVRFAASFERTLANRLLATSIAPPDDVNRQAQGLVASIRAYLTASSTWRGLGFILLKFWIGILSFILLVSLLGTAVELVLTPLYPAGALNVEVGNWQVAHSIDTTVQRAVAVPAGVVLGIVALHLLNAFASANATIASSLLGDRSATEQSP